MPDSSPEWAALQLATAASHLASAARSALGGYVPINHRDHPSTWSPERQDALAAADEALAAATEALRLATKAHAARVV